jgi:anti-sigma factor RsiW
MIEQGIMSCEFVRESLSGYVDERLAEADRGQVALHLASCRECAAVHKRMTDLCGSLRGMRMARMPRKLAIDLKILASKELLRSRQTKWEQWMDWARLTMDNMMRPFAVPAAGGFASALLMFAILVPGLNSLRGVAASPAYSVEAVEPGAPLNPDETIIEVQIDDRGRMVDYYMPQGQMTSEIGNLLLFSTFTPAAITPANQFLQPNSGKVVIRISRIVVKG